MRAFVKAVRSSPRFPLDRSIDWRVEGTVTHFVSRALDISAGGVFIATPTQSPVGTSVLLRLDLADGRLDVDGTVVRTQTDGVAVALFDTQERPLAPLRRILASRRMRRALVCAQV